MDSQSDQSAVLSYVLAKSCPVEIIQTRQPITHTVAHIRSHDLHLRPGVSSSPPCLPRLIGAEDREKKRGDDSFNPFMNALFFSLRVILKRCSRLSPSKAPSIEAPGTYFIQPPPNFILCTHTQAHTEERSYKLQVL